VSQVNNTEIHIELFNHNTIVFGGIRFLMFRTIDSNLDTFHYTYGSGKLNIISKPACQDKDILQSRI